MDLFDKFDDNFGDFGKYRKLGHGYFMFPKLEGEIGSHMKFRGKDMLTWSLTNYLGLANHEEIRQADTEAIQNWGLAYPMGARILNGQTSLHETLEHKLAEYVGMEDAFALNNDYAGLTSLIDTLLCRNDCVVYDVGVKQNIIDGIRLHKGKRLPFKHNDIGDLAKQLGRAEEVAKKQNGGVLVITEGVFHFTGELAPLDEIITLKNQFNFRLLLDDSHGFGTMGSNGKGTADYFSAIKNVDIYFSSFAQALAGFGAFVAGDEAYIDVLRYNMKSQVYSKSLPNGMVEASIKRLELISKETELRTKLWDIVHYLQNELRNNNFDIGLTKSCITPVYLNASIAEASGLIMDMRENYNLFCTAVVYPLVKEGEIMLRLIPTAIHTKEDVDYTLKALTALRECLLEGKYVQDALVSE